MTRVTVLLFCVVLAVHAPAQADSLLRSSVSVEWARDVAVDASGFVYTLSSTADPYGTSDVVVRRYAPGSGEPTNVFTFGGSGYEAGVALAITGETIYVTGRTYSYDLPVHNAVQPYSGGDVDVFIAAFGLDGTIRYATYFGGYASDEVRAMAVSPNGQVHLVGHVYNEYGGDPLAGLPTTAPPLNESDSSGGFVANLDASGTSLAYSRRFDGAANIAADATGRTYVVSDDFRAGMMVTKLSAGGHMLYRAAAGPAYSRAVAADAEGNVYVAGPNLTDDFATPTAPQPHPSGLAGAVLTKLNPAGVRVFATYIGGNDPKDDVSAVDLETDDSGNVYFLGTGSGVATLHQIAPPAAGNTFVVKVRSDGAVIYSTPLGSGGGQAHALATFGRTVTVLGSSDPAPSIPDERFRGTFLATLGDPTGTDVSVVTSVSTPQPEAGKPLSYVGTVLVGAEAVDWTTVTVTLPGDAAGLGCTATGAISCAQRENTWVATYARLPAYAQRRVVVAARGTCTAGPAPYVLVSFALATSAYEEPEHRTNNHRDVRLLVANAAPTVTLRPSTYWLAPAAEGLVSVALSYDVNDDCDPPPVCTIEVESSDATATPDDWEVVGDREVRLRSGRPLAGRIYEIRRRCVDASGHPAIATTWVQVESSEPPPSGQQITAGAVYMYTDREDSMRLDLRGDGFAIHGEHPGGFGYPCSTCADARFSQRLTFDGEGWFAATIGDRHYPDIRLVGTVRLDTGLVALDEYYPSVYNSEPEIRGQGNFFVSGRVSGFTRAGDRLFDVTITGGGQLRLDLWGQDTLMFVFDDQAVAPVVAQRLRVHSPTRPVSLPGGSTQRIEWTYQGPASTFLIIDADWRGGSILATVPRRPGRTQFADVAIDRQYFDAALLVIAVGDTAALDTTAPIRLTP